MGDFRISGRPNYGLFSNLSIRTGSSAQRLAPARASGIHADRAARRFGESLLVLSDATARLREVSDLRSRSRAGLTARTGSQTVLGLSSEATRTTLRSTEEVNTIATSYGPRSPSFAGSSTSSPTVGGQYDGSNGDTTLTFTSTLGGSVGLTPVRIEVRDSAGTLLDTISQGLFQPAGTVHTLSNGLTVAFGSGTVVGGDSFTVDAFATVGSVVDPSAAFNQGGGEGPGFDEGLSVTTGAFQLNGVTIAVNASDSILDVLDRINSSAAGVQATFEVSSERVVLTQEADGPAGQLDLSGDSSGFLAATKLAGATATPGEQDERLLALDQLAAFATVQSGTFTINGVELTLDVTTDSLIDVIERINAAGLGVVASYSADQDRFGLRSQGSGAITLADGTSGLLSALGLADGSVRSQPAERSSGFTNRKELLQALREFARAYRAVQDGLGGELGVIRRGRDGLDAAVGKALDAYENDAPASRRSRRLGLSLVEDGDQRFLELNQRHLTVGLGRGARDLERLLFAGPEGSSSGGLVGAVESQVGLALAGLEGFLGASTGLRVNLRA